MSSALNSKNEKIFQFFWTLFFILVTCIAMVPILRVVSMSFSAKDAITAGKVFIFPVGFNTEAYVKAVNSGSFIRAFGYSIVLMIGSTVVNLVMTVLAAYPLSKKNLIGGGLVMTLFVMTMYLNPGVIPTYLNVRDFGLINKVWALIIPGALSAYNMIIMCNAFRGIDSAIYEAATIDGCSQFRTLTSVALPLVYPTIATLGLFYAVGRWNGINDVMYYINDSVMSSGKSDRQESLHQGRRCRWWPGRLLEVHRDPGRSGAAALRLHGVHGRAPTVPWVVRR